MESESMTPSSGVNTPLIKAPKPRPISCLYLHTIAFDFHDFSADDRIFPRLSDGRNTGEPTGWAYFIQFADKIFSVGVSENWIPSTRPLLKKADYGVDRIHRLFSFPIRRHGLGCVFSLVQIDPYLANHYIERPQAIARPVIDIAHLSVV